MTPTSVAIAPGWGVERRFGALAIIFVDQCFGRPAIGGALLLLDDPSRQFRPRIVSKDGVAKLVRKRAPPRAGGKVGPEAGYQRLLSPPRWAMTSMPCSSTIARWIGPFAKALISLLRLGGRRVSCIHAQLDQLSVLVRELTDCVEPGLRICIYP